MFQGAQLFVDLFDHKAIVLFPFISWYSSCQTFWKELVKKPHIQQFEETLGLLSTNWKGIKLLHVFSLVLPLSSI